MTPRLPSTSLATMSSAEPTYPEFAARLSGAMSRSGKEIKDISKALRVSYEMARRYTIGEAFPRADKWDQLAGLLGVSVGWLITGQSSYTDLDDVSLKAIDIVEERLTVLGKSLSVSSILKIAHEVRRDLESGHATSNDELDRMIRMVA